MLGVKEPQPQEIADAARGPDPVHLPPPRPGAGAHPGALRLGRDLRRLRDGRGPKRPPAAPGADVGGGRQDRDPGGCLHAREAARRARDPARWRPRGRPGQRDGDRRRRRRDARGVHRDRDGGGRVRLRRLAGQAQRARHRLRRPRLDRVQLDAVDRGEAARHGPGDRRRARPRRTRAARDHAASSSG